MRVFHLLHSIHIVGKSLFNLLFFSVEKPSVLLSTKLNNQETVASMKYYTQFVQICIDLVHQDRNYFTSRSCVTPGSNAECTKERKKENKKKNQKHTWVFFDLPRGIEFRTRGTLVSLPQTVNVDTTELQHHGEGTDEEQRRRQPRGLSSRPQVPGEHRR